MELHVGAFRWGEIRLRLDWKMYALLSGTFEVVANLLFLIAITNLELSKVGVFMASAPALSALIAIKLLKQRPSLANWLGIAATSSALALIALNQELPQLRKVLLR